MDCQTSASEAAAQANRGAVLFRAYSKWNTDTSCPDLIVTENGDRFGVFTQDGEYDWQVNKTIAWTFERFELMVGNTTLSIATVASLPGAAQGDNELQIFPKGFVQIPGHHPPTQERPTLILATKCLCIVGGAQETLPVQFQLIRWQDSTTHQFSTRFYTIRLGDLTGNVNGGDDAVNWAELADVLDPHHYNDGLKHQFGWATRPYLNLSEKDTHGPFFAPNSPITNAENSPKVFIQRISYDHGLDTLQFVFTKDESHDQTALDVSYKIPRGNSIHDNRPLSDDDYFVLRTGGGEFEVVQQPSELWLKRSTDKSHAWNFYVYSTALGRMWNGAVENYNQALRTSRNNNRLSFLPKFLAKDGSDESIGMKLQYSADIAMPGSDPQNAAISYIKLEWADRWADADGTPVGNSHFGLLTTNYRGCFDFGGSDKRECDCVITPFTDKSKLSPGSLAFTMGLKGGLGVNAKTRVGSLDITFAINSTDVNGNQESGTEQLQSTFVLHDIPSDLSPVPRLSASFHLPVSAVEPGGQDGIPGNEYVPENFDSLGDESQNQCSADAYIEQDFDGSAPVVIPLKSGNDSSGSPNTPFWAEITEANPEQYSQTVSIKLHALPRQGGSGSQTASERERVIVLDSGPFLVAEVVFDGFTPRTDGTSSDVVAIWDMNRVDGVAWELQTAAQPFDLILPPQSLGEEMIKGMELAPKDQEPPNSGTPLDFRYSPPTVATLNASYTPQNYTEAPWNLRRILGYPGQRDAGAGVQHLQYELLYGLSCNADVPMLRLAEILSTIGRIPGRLPTSPVVPVVYTDGNPARVARDLDKDWLNYRIRWADYNKLYSKRVGVLEPRFSGANYSSIIGQKGATTTPEVVSLDEGVSCSFRTSKDLYYLATLDNVSEDEFNINPQGFKGGATYGFEEPRIYHATLRNPISSSAKLVNPFFTSLGGTGFQKASFDNNLTSVYSDTSIGRTFYYSIERMGRVGVYHNLARHVIEYERSTEPGPQFADSQPCFLGRPVLRKIREYVQILEPKAYLSDGPNQYPEAGCVKAIEFKTTVIPVHGSWGANVGLVNPATGKPTEPNAPFGWKIPLWRRFTAPATAPKCNAPKFNYDKPEIVFDLAGSEGVDVECAISDPEKLFFYTETKEGADPDPHKWPLVEGVDFSHAPMPTSNPPFKTNSTTEIAAHDFSIPVGLSAFTMHLEPGHGTIDMVHGRAAQAVGAVVRTVTMQKAVQVSRVLTQGIDVAGKIQELAYLVRGTANDGTTLFDVIRTLPPVVPQIPNTVVSGFTVLSNSCKDLKDHLQGQFNDTTNAVGQQERALADNWIGQVQTVTNTFGASLASALSQASKDKESLQNTLQEEVSSLFTRIECVPASANVLSRYCSSVKAILLAARGDNDSVKRSLDAEFEKWSNAAANASQKSAVIELLKNCQARFSGLSDQLRSAVQAGIEPWMPGVGMIVHQWEGAINGSLTQMGGLISGAMSATASDISGLQKQFDGICDLITTSLETAGHQLSEIGNPNLISDQLSDLRDKLHNSATTLVGQLIGQGNEIVQRIATEAQQKLDSLVKSAQQTIATQVQTSANVIASQFAKVVDASNSEVTGVLTSLQASLLNANNIASETLETYRKQAEDAFGRYADSVLSNLPPQVDFSRLSNGLPKGDAVQAALQRAFGDAPKVPNLDFSLPNVGYFYTAAADAIGLTPVLTNVSGLGAALSPLETALPSASMLERMVPLESLKNFNLSDVLPKFSGLDLSGLFSGLKMPDGSDKYIKITHGLDQAARTAWVNADINFATSQIATVFSIGPITLQLPKATFQAQVKMSADANGQVAKKTTGIITGDWNLVVGGMGLITLKETSLSFDEQGHVHFDVSPAKVQLAQALAFIEDFISQYTSPDSGFSIIPSAAGIQTRLALPIPNTSAGTTGITNLTFGFNFGLEFLPFAITTGFSLGRADAPFNISIFILGGGGYVETDARFVPGQGITCSVAIELAASASLAVAFGPISGYVAIFVGMSVHYSSRGGSGLSLGVYILVVGEVSILSIISAYVSLRLEASYNNGVFTGRGTFSISIKICWCFTLSVSESVHYSIGGGDGNSGLNERPQLFPAIAAVSDSPASAILIPPEIPDFTTIATRYINMIS